MLSHFVDRGSSIEDLEGNRWPDPPKASTTLVRSVHELRRRAIKNLTVEDLRRLITQDVGLRWLLPTALDFLRETAPQEAVGWYDEDLLSALLTRRESVWRSAPELARHLDRTVRMLTDLSPHVQRDVECFRTTLSDLL
ncbi:contact-dependent growth inhibition system immunity protein [Streptomyces olivaceoviridis]|uniref:contact-dependent growth inhibition system immunity protein n=1 Tax=Streptomyces olivaceoviridis TaxID=1921 RepID=UPI00367826AF